MPIERDLNPYAPNCLTEEKPSSSELAPDLGFTIKFFLLGITSELLFLVVAITLCFLVGEWVAWAILLSVPMVIAIWLCAPDNWTKRRHAYLREKRRKAKSTSS